MLKKCKKEKGLNIMKKKKRYGKGKKKRKVLRIKKKNELDTSLYLIIQPQSNYNDIAVMEEIGFIDPV